ncbi:MAG: site-specific recombinase XerD [Parasphingorhabdus sp.]|jgi:site-specific recombinase XerD
MKKVNKLMLLVQCFFQEYLVADRGLSQNTVMAYRDTLKLFFSFESSRQNKSVSKLVLDDVNADAVLHFLNQLEKKRNNGIVTRNLRLAALKTFSLFLTTKDILRAGEYQRIIALPLKKAPHKVIDYLEVNEINAIIGEFDHGNMSEQRNHTLLSLLYNTGARVQEMCDLTVGSITLGHLPAVTLVGKGNKTRIVPIWQDTAQLLTSYLQNHQLMDNPTARLFLNACGQPLGRFGIRYIIKKRVERASTTYPRLKTKTIGPHTFRHSIAMHLLQAGIDLSIIKSWLGHVNLQTTHTYVEIDMEMKRKVLNAYSPFVSSESLKSVLSRNRDILTWLESI